MAVDPTHLLKQLEPVVRPGFALGPAARPHAPLEDQGFDELLKLASQGSVHSGRAVTDASGATEKLDEQQMARLAAAADLAEASGARQALLLIDGRGLILDVPNRALTAQLSADESSRVVNIDAAVYVAADDEERDDAVLVLPEGIAPPAVAQQIEAAWRARESAADVTEVMSIRERGLRYP